MDDISTATSVNLLEALCKDEHERPKPLKYCERTEQILPSQNNLLQYYLDQFETFTLHNKMKITMSKTKVMKFSRSSKYDFPLEVSFSNDQILEQVGSTRLLGLIIDENLKWDKNTEYISKKVNSKFFLLRNMR